MSEINTKSNQHQEHDSDGFDLSKISFGKVLAMIGLASAGLVGCGPAKVEKWEDVGPNQTAFKIAMEGDEQTQFESEKFLQARKVPAKRIGIEQRQATTGRMPWNYKWVPTTIVIKVDRGLVTREWTSANDTNEESNNDALLVTSKDGVGIYFGINLTARIDEPMAARYLYFHGQRSLSEVVDTNIRSDIQGLLSGTVGNMTRIEIQNGLPAIFAKLTPEVKKLAMERGITIETIGPAEGLKYANPEVQKSIDAQVIAENMKKTEIAKQEAAKIANATAIDKAKSDAEVGRLVAQNSESLKKKAEMEALIAKSKAAQTLAEKWDGKLPDNIMPANSPMLQQLGITAGK